VVGNPPSQDASPPTPPPVSAERLLQDLATALAAAGADFFSTLVRYLTLTLGVEFAYVGEFAGERHDKVRTLAVCIRGEIVDNLEYAIAPTPCLIVVRDGFSAYNRDVQRLFPDDTLAVEMGVESYMGIALTDASGQALGLLSVMDAKPLRNPKMAEWLLRIFATRAATELERLRAHEALHRSERRFRSYLELPLIGIAVSSPEKRWLEVNDRLCEILGYPRETLLGKRWDELTHPADLSANLRVFEQALGGELDGYTLEKRFLRKDGTAVHASLSARCVRRADGTPDHFVVLVDDVTPRKLAEAEMHKLSSAIQQTADAVMITDRNGVIEYVNPAFERTTGYSRGEALGRKPSLVKSGLQSPEFYRRLWDTVLAGETFREVFINRRKDGEIYYEEKTISPLKDDLGHVTHFISTGKDITERMQAQERLQYLAHHDALTDLPNRVLFLDRLDQVLARGRWRERVVGVMFLDLDRFKNINDSLGHDVGDRFLKTVAARLKAAVREGDTVARLSGDEFGILLEDVAHAEDVSGVAGKVLQTFAAPFALDGREFYLSASIGISLYPNDGSDAATLLKHADAAMYRAKELGKNNFQFYSADMSAQAFERLTLETGLRRALARREFLLHYQPQVDLASGRLVGVEALLRWRHPDFGLIGPMQFIHLAEETGLIVPLGEWVLRSACEQARAWEARGLALPQLALNLSGRQFHQPGFIDTARRVLGECALRTTQLELEITESVIMQDARLMVDRLQVLYALGVHFAIDDFGTGYSSLSYLKRFPIHTLKIDRSFVQDVTTDPDDAEIVRAIVVMAHSLRLKVVAEGVETAEQLALLRAMECDAVQGYYFSRALAADEIEPWLRAGGRPGSGAQRVADGEGEGKQQ